MDMKIKTMESTGRTNMPNLSNIVTSGLSRPLNFLLTEEVNVTKTSLKEGSLLHGIRIIVLKNPGFWMSRLQLYLLQGFRETHVILKLLRNSGSNI